ncbi:MAG: hypothetical protein Q9220_001662 [cf. Caloplaca sp. 1 TL-2023]
MASRFLDHGVGDWHRITNDDALDEHLDFYYGHPPPPILAHTLHDPDLDRCLNWSAPRFAHSTRMEPDEHLVSPRVEPKIELPEQEKDVGDPTLLPDAGHDDSHGFNPFDDPTFHLQDGATTTDNHEQHVSHKRCEEPKREGLETTSPSTNGPFLVADTALDSPNVEGPQHLQRTLTEPMVQGGWSYADSQGTPPSTYIHPVSNGLPQVQYSGFQAQGQMPQSRTNFSRVRAHTTNSGPTSNPHQPYPRLNPAHLRQQVSTRGFLNNVHSAGYSNSGISRPVQTFFSDSGREYISPEAFGNPSMRSAHNIGLNGTTWGSNTFRGADNNIGQFVNSHNIPPEINGSPNHFINPNKLQNHPYSTVTSSRASKFETPLEPSVARDGPDQTKHQYRSSMKREAQSVLSDDDAESPTTSKPYELNYLNIKAARDAERPPFKTNKSRDSTIPMEDEQKQAFVARLVRCMLSTTRAEDNKGMISQWQKLKQDEPRVEQAAWRLLDMVLQLHTQKTMCKHLLGSEFTAQLVNDPTTATQRVQNNRKVNAGKKSYLDHGRRVVKTRAGQDGYRDSSRSTQPKHEDSDDEGLFGHMGDEDADGEIDEEYHQHMNGHIGKAAHAAEPASQGFGSSVRTKREIAIEHEDNGRRAKKRKRPESAFQNHPTAPMKKIKATRDPNNSRSKYQSINGCMIDLHDKSNEAKVMESGSDKVRAMFVEHHYPNSANSRPRRSMRAAAPKHFVGQDNSDGDEDEDQDQDDLEAEDEDEDDEYQ